MDWTWQSLAAEHIRPTPCCQGVLLHLLSLRSEKRMRITNIRVCCVLGLLDNVVYLLVRFVILARHHAISTRKRILEKNSCSSVDHDACQTQSSAYRGLHIPLDKCSWVFITLGQARTSDMLPFPILTVAGQHMIQREA